MLFFESEYTKMSPGSSGVRKTVKPTCKLFTGRFLYAAPVRQHPRLPCVKGGFGVVAKFYTARYIQPGCIEVRPFVPNEIFNSSINLNLSN